jgi:hypothetical protein
MSFLWILHFFNYIFGGIFPVVGPNEWWRFAALAWSFMNSMSQCGHSQKEGNFFFFLFPSVILPP